MTDLRALGLLVLLAVCIALFVGFIIQAIRRRKARRGVHDAYVEALRLLISGRKELAFEQLKLAVRQNSDNVDAYLKLGDLFRERGQVERALQIHRELSVRSSVPDEMRVQVWRSLARDYAQLSRHEQAIMTLKKLLSSERGNVEAQHLLLAQYEATQQWEEAFDVQKRILKLTNEEDSSLLALYKVYVGRELMAAEEFHQARIIFKQALKLDRECVAAYYYLGLAYLREDRLDDAAEWWSKLVTHFPEKSHFVFQSLEKVLYEQGRFEEITKIYQEVVNANPKDVHPYLALATIYEKKGDISRAIELCRQAVTTVPSSIRARQRLIDYCRQVENWEEMNDVIDDLVEMGEEEEGGYICEKCNYRSEGPLWRCPRCREWNTFGI